MKTIDDLIEHGGNKRIGNYAIERIDRYIKFYLYGSLIAVVDRTTNQYIVNNSDARATTVRATNYINQKLTAMGCHRMLFGKLKQYPRKGVFFETVWREELELHSSYNLEKHMKSPETVVFGTMRNEGGINKVLHVSYDMSHWVSYIKQWYNKEILYL